MAWMIIKSAGDDFSFAPIHVDGEIGHPYSYAVDLAHRVTEAMKTAQSVDNIKRRLNRRNKQLEGSGVVSSNEPTPLQDLLSLVGVNVPPHIIAKWNVRTFNQVERWAAMMHLAANDNNVTVPPMPKVIEPFSGLD